MIATPALLFYVIWAELDHTYPRTAEKSKEEDKVKLGVVETMQKGKQCCMAIFALA